MHAQSMPSQTQTSNVVNMDQTPYDLERTFDLMSNAERKAEIRAVTADIARLEAYLERLLSNT